MPPVRGSAPEFSVFSVSNAHPYNQSSPFSTPKKVRQSETPEYPYSANTLPSPATPGRLLHKLLESPVCLRNGRQAVKIYDEQQAVDGRVEAQHLEQHSDNISSFHFSPIRLYTPLLDLKYEKPSTRLNATLNAPFDAPGTPETTRDRSPRLAPDSEDEDRVSLETAPEERNTEARIYTSTGGADLEPNPFYSPPRSPLPLSSILNDAALTLLLDDEQTSDDQAEQGGNTLLANGLDWMYANDIRSTATLEELRLLDVYQLVKPMLVPRPPPPSPIIEHNRPEDINAAVRDGGIHDGLDYDAGSSSRATDTAAHAIAQALRPIYLLSEVQERLLPKEKASGSTATCIPSETYAGP